MKFNTMDYLLREGYKVVELTKDNIKKYNKIGIITNRNSGQEAFEFITSSFEEIKIVKGKHITTKCGKHINIIPDDIRYVAERNRDVIFMFF